MEKRLAANLCFTFETKAPKIAKEKWAAFPPRMENRLASNFSILKTKAPKIVKEKWAAFPP